MTYRDTSASPQDFAKRRTAGIWSPGSGSTAFNLGSGTSTSPVAMARVGGTVFGAYQLYSGFTTSVLVASLPVDSAVPIPAPSYDADLLDPTVAADDTSMTADPAGGLALLGYDAVAPVLGSVNVPGSATAGDPVPFSAAADDVWDVSYAWDYGDGSPAGSGAAPTHSYAAPGTYTVQLRVTDGGGGQDTQTRAIAIAPAPSPTPVVSTPTPPPAGPAATVPLPVETKSGNAQPVSGTVKIQKPGSASFVQLIDLTQLPVGTVIDATKGRVTLIIEATKGVYKQADFFEGKFKFTQPKVKAGNAFAELDLAGSSFGKCPATRKVTAAAKRKTNTKSVRHLWGDGSGPFRTVGRFSSATIRGTRWLTDDRCDGTLTRVSKGAVTVRDFVLRKSIALKAPKQYLAKAPLRKTR
jgi:PKD repeat protein